MNFIKFLKYSRESFLDRHASASHWSVKLFSALTYSAWSATQPFMSKYCRGITLDAGSGRGTWKDLIGKTAEIYESIDIAPRGDSRPTWVGDIMHMSEVPDGRYDTVVSHQVLEHVRDPRRALEEFNRVLKIGGHIIISVPHLSRRHELPHDFFRFTQEGMVALAEDTGFEVVDVQPYGGIFSFLHHQTSFLFPGLFMGIRYVGEFLIWANAPFSWMLAKLDYLIDRKALLPAGVVLAGRKSECPKKPD